MLTWPNLSSGVSNAANPTARRELLQVRANHGAGSRLGLIARLPPFSPIFSKIGEVQPKVDFSQKSIFRRDSTPKLQNLAAPLLQKYIIKLIINR
jgi:hypothetical protein